MVIVSEKIKVMLNQEKHPKGGGGCELGFLKTFQIQQVQAQYKQK